MRSCMCGIAVSMGAIHKISLGLAGVVLCIAGCGSTEQKPETSTSTGGSGSGGSITGGTGSGGAPIPPPSVMCGAATCAPISAPNGFVTPCCADPVKGTCGADTSALNPAMGCQPLSRPGELDPTCPASDGATLNGFPLPAFPGCCQPNGQCGYAIDDLGGALPFAPGCIDARTLVPTSTPRACGEGAPALGTGGTTATAGAFNQATGGTTAGGAGSGGAP